MLQIGPKSLAALSSVQDPNFCPALCQVLRDEMPREASSLADPSLETLVDQTVAKCRGWGINSPESIGQICALALGFGLGMLDAPDVAAHLGDQTTPPDIRVEEFVQALEQLDG